MLEWLKRHAWKACGRQKRLASSNLALSAKSQKNASSLLERVFFMAFCKAPPQAGRDVASREAAQANLGESEMPGSAGLVVPFCARAPPARSTRNGQPQAGQISRPTQANLAELSEHSDEISERARFSQKFPIFAKSNAIASVL